MKKKRNKESYFKLSKRDSKGSLYKSNRSFVLRDGTKSKLSFYVIHDNLKTKD